MLIPSMLKAHAAELPSLSRRVNANSQRGNANATSSDKLIKKGEC